MRHYVLLLILGLACACASAQRLEAQTSPNCATIPPNQSIIDSRGTWTLAGGVVRLNGTVQTGGLAESLNKIDPDMFMVAGGTAYRYVAADNWPVVGTLPVCAGAIPPIVAGIVSWTASPVDATHMAADGYKLCLDTICGAKLGNVLTTTFPTGTPVGLHTVTVIAYNSGGDSPAAPDGGLKVNYNPPPPTTTGPNIPGNVVVK